MNEKWVLFILRLELLRGCVGFYGGLLGFVFGCGKKGKPKRKWVGVYITRHEYRGVWQVSYLRLLVAFGFIFVWFSSHERKDLE